MTLYSGEVTKLIKTMILNSLSLILVATKNISVNIIVSSAFVTFYCRYLYCHFYGRFITPAFLLYESQQIITS